MNGSGLGGAPASPLLLRAIELTEGGEWHDYHEIVRQIAKMVPPGRAMRRVETERRYDVDSPPNRVHGRDTARLVELGQRSIARDHLKRAWFDVDPIGVVPCGVVKRIRLARLPPRVARDRRLAEQGRLMRPDVLIPLLVSGGDVTDLLGEMSTKQLIRLVEAMVTTLRGEHDGLAKHDAGGDVS